MDGLVLLDTHTNILVEDTATSFSIANYRPLYIGPRLDSIRLNYDVYDFSVNHDYWKYAHGDSMSINIYVDTTQYVGSAGCVFRPPPPPPPRNSDMHDYGFVRYQGQTVFRGDYKSYPVLIQNTSYDTLNIGFCKYILLRLEAQDIFGEWRLLQGFFDPTCENGNHFPLPPDHIIISSCPIFKGWYRTKLRLVYGLTYGYGYEQPVYSNTFYGNIDYRQMYQKEGNDDRVLMHRKRRTSFKLEN
jgi:hypothetical protein